LELGFVYQDAGRIDEALAAFEQAMHGARLKGDDGIDPLAVAAANRGRILAAKGLHQEAYDSFAYCRSRDSTQTFTAVEQAEQLRRIGQIDMAASSYAVGMEYRGARWNLPEFPHDARTLSFWSLSPWKQIGLHALVDVPVRSAREQTVATPE
jgi:tetratricopeptide (TPR) repeat protein